MKVIYLAIASDDPIHEKDRSAQLDTWVREISDLDYVFWLRGGQKKKVELNGNDLITNVEERYENILAKTIAGVDWLLNNFEFDFLVRTNVSTYFQPNLVRATLGKLDISTGFLGGYFEYSRDSHLHSTENNKFVSGASMILNKSACQKLIDIDLTLYNGVPDDVAISNHLNQKGLSANYMGRCNLGYSHIFFEHFATRVKSSKNFTLAGPRMYLLHNYFTRANSFSRLIAFLKIYLFEFRTLSFDAPSFLDYIKRIHGLLKNHFRSSLCG